MNKAKLYKLTNTIISFIIGVLAAYFIYTNLFKKAGGFDWGSVFYELQNHYAVLFVVFGLMILNWSIELFKWNLLLKKIQLLSLSELVKSLCFGILLSLITPNRVGELGGRQLFIKKENRLSSIYIQSFLAISQLVITLIMGLTAALVTKEIWLTYNVVFSPWLKLLLVTAIALIVISYFFSSQLMKLIRFVKMKFMKSAEKEFLILPKSLRFKVLMCSFSRYNVFSLQFILLYLIFEKTGDYPLIFWALALTFFTTAVIPTAWISDLLVRTSVIFYIFNMYSLNGKSAMLASLLLWVINLLVPAIVGFFSLNKVNWTSLKTWKLQ